MSSIEIHEADDWAAVYLDGKLQRVGDAYLADEWVRQHFGVTTVNDDAFMRGQTKREGVASTLEEVEAFRTRRDANKARAAELRSEADRLIREAVWVEAGEKE